MKLPPMSGQAQRFRGLPQFPGLAVLNRISVSGCQPICLSHSLLFQRRILWFPLFPFSSRSEHPLPCPNLPLSSSAPWYILSWPTTAAWITSTDPSCAILIADFSEQKKINLESCDVLSTKLQLSFETSVPALSQLSSLECRHLSNHIEVVQR